MWFDMDSIYLATFKGLWKMIERATITVRNDRDEATITAMVLEEPEEDEVKLVNRKRKS